MQNAVFFYELFHSLMRNNQPVKSEIKTETIFIYFYKHFLISLILFK